MIYDLPFREASPDQGDIIEGCLILHISTFDPQHIVAGDPGSLQITCNFGRVLVVTQTCDLANQKTTIAVVARMHDAHVLVHHGVLKPSDIRGPIRSGRVYGWYFLPASDPHTLPESLVDLRQLHTVRLDLLRALIRQGNRLCRLATPYREHLSQHFATTYSRIGLPEPYDSQLDPSAT